MTDSTQASAQDTTTGGGTGAEFTVSWGVNATAVSDGGQNFTSTPTVAFSGGGGTGATATAVMEEYPLDVLLSNGTGGRKRIGLVFDGDDWLLF